MVNIFKCKGSSQNNSEQKYYNFEKGTGNKVKNSSTSTHTHKRFNFMCNLINKYMTLSLKWAKFRGKSNTGMSNNWGRLVL